MVEGMLRIFLILTLLCATGGAVEAQVAGDHGSKQGPVGHLMRHQTELGLSSAQIARLREIDDEMDAQNQPLVAQLSRVRAQIRAMGPRENLSAEGRRELDDHMSAFRRTLRQIERNNHAAMKQVGSVLTPPQQERLSRLLKDRNTNSGRNDNSSNAPGRD